MLEEDLALRLIQFAAVIDVMVLERFPSFDREFVVEGFMHALHFFGELLRFGRVRH